MNRETIEGGGSMKCKCVDLWNIKPPPICDKFIPWEEDEGCRECDHDKACHEPDREDPLRAERYPEAIRFVREYRAVIVKLMEDPFATDDHRAAYQEHLNRIDAFLADEEETND